MHLIAEFETPQSNYFVLIQELVNYSAFNTSTIGDLELFEAPLRYKIVLIVEFKLNNY